MIRYFVILFLYVFTIFQIVTIPLWVGLWLVDQVLKRGLPFTVMEWLGIVGAVSILGATLLVLIYLRQTRTRRDDPFRFNRTQFRFVTVPESIDPERIERQMRDLGYDDILTSPYCGDNDFEVTGKKGPLTYHPLDTEADSLLDRRGHIGRRMISVKVGFADGFSKVIMSAAPTKWYEYADMTQSTYYLLEELIDAMNWRSALVDRQGV